MTEADKTNEYHRKNVAKKFVAMPVVLFALALDTLNNRLGKLTDELIEWAEREK